MPNNLVDQCGCLIKNSLREGFDTRMLHQKSDEAFNKGTVWTEEGRNLYRVGAGYKTEAVAKDLANSAVAKIGSGAKLKPS